MYNKLMLKNGDMLSETHLNHIENGVLEVERSASQFKKTIAKIITSKGVPAYETDSFDVLSNKINLLGAGVLPPNEGDGEENGLIDIRQTVKSGQIQLLCTDTLHGNIRIRVYTTDGSLVSVDWGDGTSGVYTSGEDIRHSYQSGTGAPYLENNNQWVATITAGGGNVIYRFATFDNSDFKWFASRDVYFTYVYSMFSGGDTTVHAPSGLLYVDLIGGGLTPDPAQYGGSSDAAHLFRSCVSLERVSGVLNTAKAISVANLFCDCYNLVDIPDIINISAATAAWNMFSNCRSLKKIPELISTRNITNASGMFRNCYNITEVPDLYFDNCTHIGDLFISCEKLESAYNIYNTGRVTNAWNIFHACSNLKRVPNVLDLGSAIDAYNLFRNCTSLVDAPSVIHLDSAKTIYDMFYGCSNLKNAPTIISAPNAVNASNIFYNCFSLRKAPTNIILPKGLYINNMFYGCRSLTEGPAEINFPEALETANFFSGCELLQEPPRVFSVPNSTNVWSIFFNCLSLRKTPEVFNIQSAQRCYNLFNGCNNLEEVLFEEVYVPQALEIYSMFYGCKQLRIPPKITAPNATLAYALFYGCTKLQTTHELNLPAALQIHEIYRDCSELQEIKAIHAPKATHWNGVYRDCRVLQKVESIGGPEAMYIQYMFYSGAPLIAEIPNFLDFSKVVNADYWMYKGDPVRVKGPITIKGLRTNFELVNCRELTSIRIQDMDPLCGNLNFQNCAMEADDINLLFEDLIETTNPAWIRVSGNPGAADCNSSIAEAKGWTVHK